MADKSVAISLGYKYDDREADALINDLDKIERGVKDAARANNSYVDSQRQIANATDSTTQAIKAQTNALELRNDEFDKVSRQVGLAGDVQSNLGAISGLAGAAGFQGAAGGISVAGEIAVLAEELPRLKAALAGMPETIKAAVSAIGAGNLGLIGAIAALTVVVAKLDEIAKEAVKSNRLQIDAQVNAIELRALYSRQELEQQRADVQQQIAIAKAQQELTKQINEQTVAGLEANYNAAQKVVLGTQLLLSDLGIDAALGGAESAASALKAARDALADTSDNTAELEAELKAIEIALNGAREATSETVSTTQQATQQETALSEARTQTEVATAAVVETETVYQQQRRRIAERNAQLVQAQARDVQDAQRAAEAFMDVQRDLKEAREDANTELKRDLEDLTRTVSQDYANALTDAALDAARRSEDALAAGDFLALAQIKKDAQRSNDDLARETQRGLDREAYELRLAYNRRLEDVALAARRETEILQQKYGVLEQVILGSMDRIIAGVSARMALNVDPSRLTGARANLFGDAPTSGSRVLARMG